MSRIKKRKLYVSDDEDDIGKVYRFKILLPNGTGVELRLQDPDSEMPLGDFIGLVKEKYLVARKSSESEKKKMDINWKGGGLFLQDVNDAKIRNMVQFKNYKPNKCHMLWLRDECTVVPKTFENMWDLTPDTDLLLELPEEYSFETALADLIDNSLQAVWSNERDERRLISVDLFLFMIFLLICRINVGADKISIFDSGPGMDDTDENSLVKWGKMGASLHRSSKSQAIGGKPPYLKPYFGMFGYGGSIASMYLGQGRVVISSKTKYIKRVLMLYFEREALLRSSSSGATWKKTFCNCCLSSLLFQTHGGIRDPSEEEIRDSSHGSFTKCDDMYESGKTVTPIEFQVNDVDLTEIEGGEVAVTNLHSCNGPEFVLQLHFSLVHRREGIKRPGSNVSQEANARLRLVYFPFNEGKENIEKVLEKLKVDGHEIKENFETFSRVSIRRLGRLLPEARWGVLPFMDLRNKKGNRAQILKRCSLRVKCFIETDAGFKPTPSKTDLAHNNPFTIALRNLGSKNPEKDTEIDIKIHKAGKQLTPPLLEKEYQDWILQMHEQYDEEADSGEDQPVIIFSPPNKTALGISLDVARIHQKLKRKEKSWKRGQEIKVLKGAFAGCRKNIYATIEYFLLEGLEGDTGGEAWIICRPIDIPIEGGCVLSVDGEHPTLDLRGSLSLPISVIDSAKLGPVERPEWEYQLNKTQQKSPATVDLNHGKQSLSKTQQKSPATVDVLCLNHGKQSENDWIESGENRKIVKPFTKVGTKKHLSDGPSSREVPLGSIKHAELKSQVQESQLLPGYVFKEFILEFFDAYGNHVSKGSKVTLSMEKIVIQDHGDIVRKVDDNGRIDLSGLLKLIAGYGENASLAVLFEDKIIFKQEFVTVRRKLRITPKVPDFCTAGGQLENIDFEIVDPDGDVDKNIHHNDKDGQSHLLTIRSGSFVEEESIRYTFKHGRCTIPAIPVPPSEEIFCFEAAHSQYPELNLIVEIPVVKTPRVEYDDSQPLFSGSSVQLQDSPSADQERNLISFVNADKELEDIFRIGQKIGELEKYLDYCCNLKAETKQEILKLQEKVEPHQLSNMNYYSTKEELEKRILSMENPAAFVLCKLLACQTPEKEFMELIINLVALLGTVKSPELSRILSEYLGEEKMLAIICRTFHTARALEIYIKSSDFDSTSALNAEADAPGKPISTRFLVLCLEDIRPYNRQCQGDPQMRLALPDPTLPNGRMPTGFLGYAVNMIDLDDKYLRTRTASGHGLRETVLFSLFKKLQVYETREYMMAARACIEDGAVSLDGCILRDGGIISLGYGNPLICFPCESQVLLSPETRDIITQIEELKSNLMDIEEKIDKITKIREKYLKKFEKRKDRYGRVVNGMEQPVIRNCLLECKPSTVDNNKNV
ncbi:structural maintenance of chromosomes flexible hinge domain-containing protein GMI1 [Senna tora]|uniref:Structural maintenance of chromosomes flexible hinge domain-containing protein GMI1 n=1 Tax=Senna tora TaxID=362788 RepID=A0A834WP32_9FABA|nr:structural maintenance of chromosomes flexible hinge domain-containing protein GMI1 [Senna tora]